VTPDQERLRETVARAMCIANGDVPDQMIDTLDDAYHPCWDFYYSHFAAAAISVALEEAARVAEAKSAYYDECDGSSVYACNNIAAAIRALIPSESPIVTIVDPSHPVIIGSGQPCWGLDEPPEDDPSSS
jgi:hypothetical protein